MPNRTFVGPMPDRMARLPRDVRGYPVPFFVQWEGDKPLFPVLDPAKMKACMQRNLCWICGETLGAYKGFVIGPMCCVNRISAEPPQHVDCGKFAALNCPFLAQPLAKRTDTAKFGPVKKPGGVMIERNPGVTAVWVTKSFAVIRDGGQPLWRLGPATSLRFYARGRLATRGEVDISVEGGLPFLHKAARSGGPQEQKELHRQLAAFESLLDGFVTWPEPAELPDVDLSSFEVSP